MPRLSPALRDAIAQEREMISGGRLVLVDGHHRIEAARRLGRKTIVVQYHPSNW